MRRHPGGVVLAVLVVLVLATAGRAQALSTADLADDWRVTFVATPTTLFTGSSLRDYKGDVVITSGGVVSGTLVADEFTPGALTFTATGTVTLSAQGLMTGTLTLTGLDIRSLRVEEARILANRHTLVGAATLTRPGGTDVGLVTFVRLTDQIFTRAADLVGDWNYHEVSPSNQGRGGDADWTRGSISFHPDGCSAADLFFADGTVRERRDPTNPDLPTFD